MIHGKTLRITLTGAIVAIMAAAPVAQAKQQPSTDVHVCNQATHISQGGVNDADGSDAGPAARYQTGLVAMKATGQGLVHAASRSSALSLCAPPAEDDHDTIVVYGNS